MHVLDEKFRQSLGDLVNLKTDGRLKRGAMVYKLGIQSVSLVFLVVIAFAKPGQCDVIEGGDFIEHVESLRDKTFTSGSGQYVIPNAQQRSTLANAATALMSGDLANAESIAATIDYEVVSYTDNASGRIFRGLRELDNIPTRGWGSYFVDLNATQEALVQVPHPRFDTNSWEIAALAFRDSGARAFMMAGAHRNANGQGSADVAHLADSVFQEIHEAWVGNAGERTTWSIHGFDLDNHNFPAGTDAVLSNGNGGVSSEVLNLDSLLEAEGFDSYAYNTLDIDDPTNVQVNGNVVGTTFSSLGGTTNVQGVYARGLGGTFVHVEFEQSIRFDSNNRTLAANALTGAMTGVPEASIFSGVSAIMLLLSFRRLHRR